MKKDVIPCILALLVLVIGIVVVVKLIRLCQKLFPDEPKAQTDPQPEPNLTNVVQSAWYAFPDWHEIQAPGQPCDCGCEFNLRVTTAMTEAGPALCLTNCVIPQLVDKPTLLAEVADLGINTNLRESYGSNTVPGEISYVAGAVVTGADLGIVIERSTNGAAWVPVLTNRVALGSVLDLTLPSPCSGAVFFRGRVQ